MRLTVSMPCFGRPQRTIRAIECIANQNINDWEALVIGDGCPVMQDYLNSGYFNDVRIECAKRGNELIIDNNLINQGGHGFAITNNNIKIAKGKYFVFYANDDIILPNHFENYLSQIENTDYDFVCFDSWVEPINAKRVANLQYGSIGHSELIIRTEFLRQMPYHSPEYGHDWFLIQNMMKQGKFNRGDGCPLTYRVMSLPDRKEQGID